jgi:hypothetical protein
MGTHVEEHGPSQSIHHNDVDHGQFGVSMSEMSMKSVRSWGTALNTSHLQ